MKVEPYLFFDNCCEEALEYYHKILGAEINSLMRNKESPEPSMRVPGSEEKIMYCNFRIGETTLSASDWSGPEQPAGQRYNLLILVDSDDEARRVFAGLSDGGKVVHELQKTFFASLFGMTTDRFGIPWTLVVAEQEK